MWTGGRELARLSLSFMGLFWRASAVWLLIAIAETIHGTLRAILMVPWLGDFGVVPKSETRD